MHPHPADLYQRHFRAGATMPGWLQAFAKTNLVTVTADALPALVPDRRASLARPGLDRRAAGRHHPAAVLRYRYTTT
jgi:hypothetical protein